MISRLLKQVIRVRSRLARNGIFGLFLLSTLASPLAVIVQSSNVSANNYAAMTATGRLKARDAALILNACLDIAMPAFVDVSGYTDISIWEMRSTIPDNYDVHSEIIIPAYYAAIDGKLSSNKNVTCKNFFQNYSGIMGISDISAFVDEIGMAQVTDEDSDNYGFYISSRRCTLSVNGLTPSGNTSTKNCILSAVYSRMGITGIPEMDDQMKYVAYKSILDAKEDDSNPGGCYAHWTSNVSASQVAIESWFNSIDGHKSWDDGMLGEDGNWTKIFLADVDSSEPTTKPYFVMSEGGDGGGGWQKKVVVEPLIKTVGYGWDFTTPRHGREMKCIDIANELSNNLSDKYVEWKRAHPEATPETAGNDNTIEGAASSCAIEGVGWLVCPAMNFIGTMADGAYGFLADHFLETDANLVSRTYVNSAGDEVENGVYTAWNAIRNLANVAFVIAFIVIIYSQLTGYGVSNYGVKKMLPRLVIAAILVNLSFFVCQIAVDLSNILGYSLKNVISGVSDLTRAGGVDVANQSNNPFGWAAVGVAILGGAVAIVLAISVPVLVATLLALLMIALILVGRTALIVLLVVVSPLAFVAYLFPNTEQYFKKWYKLFYSLLLLFPIIGVVFGASTLAATVIANAAGSGLSDNTEITGIIAMGIQAIPFFVVPMLLKGALNGTGALGAKISGLSNKATSGIGGKVKETSKLGAYNQARKRNAQIRRNQITGGTYSGKNPFSRMSSSANAALNSSRLTGSVGNQVARQAAAVANKLQVEEVEAASAQIKNARLTGAELASLANGGAVKGMRGSDTTMRSAAMLQQAKIGDFAGLQNSWNSVVSGGDSRATSSVASHFMESPNRPTFMGMRQLSELSAGADARGAPITANSPQYRLESLAQDGGGAYSAQKLAQTSRFELEYLATQQAVRPGGADARLVAAATLAHNTPDIIGGASGDVANWVDTIRRL